MSAPGPSIGPTLTGIVNGLTTDVDDVLGVLP